MMRELVQRLVSKQGLVVAALVLVASAGASIASAQPFPSLRAWTFAGAWQDSSLVLPSRCVGAFRGPLADSLREQPRTVSVRFLRDRVAEARPDFGGYRIYRMTNSPDSARALLLRRFSLNPGSELTWNFSRLNTATMQYECRGAVVHDSIVTFMDADSNSNFVKVCRRPGQPNVCFTPGDSIFIRVTPPGPHDGFLTWYSITYEKRNTTDTDFEDLFLPDTLDGYARCGTVGDPLTCPNLNHKLRNLVGPVEPTGGPTADLERVRVVPNPYRGREVWDQPGQNEIHFINLPNRATIRIYTVAGDLVREILHEDSVRDFQRWDLRNASGKSVASGIYMYRIEAGTFQFQDRLVIIR
jgi:hypothetical protein